MQRTILLTLCCLAVAYETEVAAEQPNIVVILADDFGVGDIQAHYPNNRIATPYLDRLVGQGISFTDAHSPSAVCSPTRYGLLTGRYAWRTRLHFMCRFVNRELCRRRCPFFPGISAA